jgi:hypothetical protein
VTCGRITRLENAEQQHHQADQQQDVYELSCLVEREYADQPGREHEERSLQEHIASLAGLTTRFELFDETGAEMRRVTVPDMPSS